MHAYNRLPNSGHTSPSPPASPRRSPRFRHVRTKHGRFNSPTPSASAASPRTPSHRIARTLLSLLLRRQGIFLFAPLIYILCMLFYIGSVSFDVVPFINHRPAPGSVYKSPLFYEKLKDEMEADTSASDAISSIWKLSHKGGQWRPCLNKPSGGLPESNGYILVEANGGLNQQRSSICNAVAVAAYLNATLVIPEFRYHSIWKDSSEFKDIYDEDFFLRTLKNDVRIVDKIPGYLMERYDRNTSNILNFRVKAWAPVRFYKEEILPRLLEEKVIRISPFANRLSFDAPLPVQRIRCLANYEALRFSSPILSLGESLVSRMKNHSMKNNGTYISVHLRFEEDMVAFSCCVYDGGKKEEEDMKAARERGWRGKFTRAGRVIRPGANRIDGKCPLTPLEVGLMLRGMGFDNTTSIYLASGEIYNSDTYMDPLLEMFPLLQTKETLASEIELAPFKGGNFPQSMLGHRRYIFGGHSKTIRPDKRKLVLFLDNPNIGWTNFKRQMLFMRTHSDLKGFELRRPHDSIYSFPCPNCMCHVNKTEDT